MISDFGHFRSNETIWFLCCDNFMKPCMWWWKNDGRSKIKTVCTLLRKIVTTQTYSVVSPHLKGPMLLVTQTNNLIFEIKAPGCGGMLKRKFRRHYSIQVRFVRWNMHFRGINLVYEKDPPLKHSWKKRGLKSNDGTHASRADMAARHLDRNSRQWQDGGISSLCLAFIIKR